MTVLEKAEQKRDAAERGMSYGLPGYDRSNLQWWTAYIEGAEDQKRGDGIAYEDEPMVKVIRALISENPDGVFVTNKELCDYATERFGYAPAASPALVGEKVRELQRELLAKDRLIVTPCKKRPRAFIRIGKPAGGSGPAAHGVEIRQYTPQPEAYQQTVLGVVDN